MGRHRTLALTSACLLLSGCSLGMPLPTGSTPTSTTTAARTTTASPTVRTASATTSRPTASTTRSASPTPIPAPSSASPSTRRPGTVTQIVEINILDGNGKLKAGYTFDNTELGGNPYADCTSPSSMATSAGTYACSPSAAGLHACWRDPVPPAGTQHLVCLRSAVDTTVVVVEPLKLAESTPHPGNPRPLTIELADGSIWNARNGGAAGYTAEGFVVSYLCATGCEPYRAKNLVVVSPVTPGVDEFVKEAGEWRAHLAQTGTAPTGYPAPTLIPITRAWFITTKPV